MVGWLDGWIGGEGSVRREKEEEEVVVVVENAALFSQLHSIFFFE